MGIPAYVDALNGSVDYHTESAGTVIDEEIQGSDGKTLALIGFDYLAAGTAHVMSILHCNGASGQRTTASAAAAASQAVLNVNDAPTDGAGNAAAASDIIAYQVNDGSWEFNTVASLSTKAITLTNNIATAVLDGAAVRIFGVVGDDVCHKISLPASVSTVKEDAIIALSPFRGDPMYVTIDNATNAGFLNNMLFGYINK